MHFLLAILFVLLFFFLIGVVVTLYYIRKGVKFFRRAATGEGMSDEQFQRAAHKYFYDDGTNGPQFDEDYFKGNPHEGKQQQKKQRRTTRTAGGVTIFDDRDPNVAQRKIFNHDEGEYVDFKEEG